jgi:nucleoside-diphosphate-sugar epimerase
VARTLLLTGGTGFIGSHLAARFLQQGHFIYFLARADRRLSAEERILRALAPLLTPAKDRYRVLDGELTLPLEIDTGEIDEVWHCAASLSFKETERVKTFAANVTGTKNLLRWIERRNIHRLHHISTAYVVGNQGGVAREDELERGQGFQNPYEESKLAAEHSVRTWSERTGGRATIYRPSIIVGDSRTGFAPKFGGFHTCAKYFFAMRQILEADLRKNPGRYDDSGIKGRGALLHLPVCFPGRPDTLVNILPIDLAVEAMLQCAKSDGTFHITNANPVRLDRLVEMTMRSMGISGVAVGAANDSAHPLIFQLNEQIKHAVKYFKPYAAYGAGSPIFDQTYTMQILGRPLRFEITEPFLRCILSSASGARPPSRKKSADGAGRRKRPAHWNQSGVKI